MVADYLTKLDFNGGSRKGELIIIGSSSGSGRHFFAKQSIDALIKMPLIKMPLVQHGDFEDGNTLKMTMLKKRVSMNAVEITVRQHKRRRNQTETYHKKVQKRWDKRSKKETKFQVVSQPKVFSMSHDLFDAINAAFDSLPKGDKDDKIDKQDFNKKD